MRWRWSLCWLTLVLGCAGQSGRVETEQSSGQIGTDQLIDAELVIALRLVDQVASAIERRR
jgi:hypothetical protein